MSTHRRLAAMIASSVIATLTIVAPSAAGASAAGRDFGHHISECARTIGFSGEHNPGMHRGVAGWGGEHCA